MHTLLKVVCGTLVLFSSPALAVTRSKSVEESIIIEQVISKYEQPVISDNDINVSEEFSVTMMVRRAKAFLSFPVSLIW
jgi:hypothetical protein